MSVLRANGNRTKSRAIRVKRNVQYVVMRCGLAIRSARHACRWYHMTRAHIYIPYTTRSLHASQNDLDYETVILCVIFGLEQSLQMMMTRWTASSAVGNGQTIYIYIFLMHFTQLCHSVIHILADGIAVQYVFIYISLARCGNMRAPSTFCISRKICGKFQNAWMLNGFSCDCLAT